MSEIMHAYIRTVLEKVEKENDITILFAVESGSRMWGFESTDSDWDIRFIYRRNDIRGYFSVSRDQLKDVVEYKDPINPLIDCVGWDIDKTVDLMYRGNGTIIDWLGSPIVYREDLSAVSLLKMFQIYMTQSSIVRGRLAMHHRGLVQRSWKEGCKKCSANITRFPLKKFFYALRSSALQIKFGRLAEQAGIFRIPSPLFMDNMEYMANEYRGLRDEIRQLIEMKTQGKESATVNLEAFPDATFLVERGMGGDDIVIHKDPDSEPFRIAADTVLRSLVQPMSRM